MEVNNRGYARKAYGALSAYWHEHGWPATVVLAVCLTLSITGIFVVEKAADAGRGGAIAVALSLLILFFFDSPGSRVFATLSTSVPKLRQYAARHADPEAPAFDTLKQQEQIDALHKQLALLETRVTGICNSFVGCQEINERAQFWINVQMAAASGIGTLVWGFGDCAHRWLFPAALAAGC